MKKSSVFMLSLYWGDIKKVSEKILNKYDFFSSLVFCFNAFINFLEIKKTATKIATIKTTNKIKYARNVDTTFIENI